MFRALSNFSQSVLASPEEWSRLKKQQQQAALGHLLQAMEVAIADAALNLLLNNKTRYLSPTIDETTVSYGTINATTEQSTKAPDQIDAAVIQDIVNEIRSFKEKACNRFVAGGPDKALSNFSQSVLASPEEWSRLKKQQQQAALGHLLQAMEVAIADAALNLLLNNKKRYSSPTIDVDECEHGHQCSANMTCRNTFGSHLCVCGAGYHPGPGQTHQTCQVDPLVCSDSGKRSSTVQRCSRKQLTSAEDVLNIAACFQYKMCQNFSVESDTKDMEAFTNTVLNHSLLETMNTNERQKVVTTILDLVDNMAMAIALTLPSSQVKTITTDSFVLKFQVIEKKNSNADHLVEMHVASNVMKIFWSSITEGTNPDFVAVSFLVFNDMESLLNREIKGGISTQRTFPLISKVVSATISNKVASSKLKEMVNFTLAINQSQEQKDNEKPTCVFWKTTEGESVWSREGCVTYGFNQTYVDCQCDHLTSFAILMAPVDLKGDRHLEVITYICLIISLLCLAASIAIFVNCSSIQNANTTVHKHLSFTLFLAQFVFLIGMRIKHKVRNLSCSFKFSALSWILT
ncbi:adhesion G protein-coupled receptor E3-like [Amblyraja radiata]|uniref:adhesion G protein-coupled receptor E3-like n=1 Tax=Amblyraja radiata TaxID=386614 RepID=UPI0014027DE3|nr:adhesion G protein-coupled receptor E3-like [Amblyraja radiata]